MQAIQTQTLELASFSQPSDRGNVVRAAWPVYRDTGAAGTAVVYFELDPGMELPTHTDSAEEILVVLEGEVEATIGRESARLSAGGVAVVPAMVPHGARNVGDGVTRVAGVFASNTIVAVFDDEFEASALEWWARPLPPSRPIRPPPPGFEEGGDDGAALSRRGAPRRAGPDRAGPGRHRIDFPFEGRVTAGRHAGGRGCGASTTRRSARTGWGSSTPATPSKSPAVTSTPTLTATSCRRTGPRSSTATGWSKPASPSSKGSTARGCHRLGGHGDR